MPGMLDAPSRIRVAWVAAAAVLVMVGIVASALAFKHPSDESLEATPQTGTPRARPFGLGPARGDHPFEIPAGCEVDKTKSPDLRIDLPDHRLELGPVRQGLRIEHDVTVRNVGTGTLCVYEPETGCGCVKATWVGDDHKVPPGGTGTIHLVVSTENREGHQEKVVTVRSNDPARPEGVPFRVTLEIRRGLMVVQSPSGMGSYFGRHAPNTPAELKVRLKCPIDEPEWKVTSVEGSRKTPFTWRVDRVEPEDKDFRQYDLTIVHPGLPAADASDVDTHNEEVKVRTTHPERPEFTLTTQMIVLTKYFASPNSVPFGYVGGSSPDRTLTAVVKPAETGAEFTVKDARVDGPGFEVVGPPHRLKEGWGIDLKYDAKPRKAGALGATLVVSFPDADFPELRIPIRATVKAD
jgi:hypothetical protein